MLDEVEDYEFVIGELTSFINQGRNTGAALHNRAIARWEIGQNEEALADFDAAIAALPASHMPAQYRGVMLHKMGQTPEAMESLGLALSIAPNDVWLRRTRGYMQAELGLLEGALLDLDHAVSLDPSFQYTVNERDKVRSLLGREQ